LFLQTIMSCGLLNGKDVKDYHKLACEQSKEAYSVDDLGQFVITINANIKTFGLEIKKAVDELTGKHFFVLINKVESDITRMHPKYSIAQTELLKRLVQAIVESDTGMISTMSALRLVNGLEQKMSQTDAEGFYQRLIQDKWLILTSLGQYTLSTRSIADLEMYIAEQFNDVAVNCSLCHKLCIMGQNCPSCPVRVHFHCATVYFRRDPSGSMPCLSDTCQAVWPRQLPPPASQDNS